MPVPRQAAPTEKSSFWGLKCSRTVGPHQRATREQPELWRSLETQAQLTPQVPMKSALWGVKAFQPHRQAQISPAQPPPYFQISKAALYHHPTKSISIDVPEDKPQPEFEQLLRSH